MITVQLDAKSEFGKQYPGHLFCEYNSVKTAIDDFVHWETTAYHVAKGQGSINQKRSISLTGDNGIIKQIFFWVTK